MNKSPQEHVEKLKRQYQDSLYWTVTEEGMVQPTNTLKKERGRLLDDIADLAQQVADMIDEKRPQQVVWLFDLQWALEDAQVAAQKLLEHTK